MVQTGLDRLVTDGFARLKGRSIGVVCNQASIDSNLDHILELLRPLDDAGFLRVVAVFGPQHGLYGHTQDNMIEWEAGGERHGGWRIHSLYGAHREPTAEMLSGIDLLVIDLQDVGARYYTFIWTMALCLRAGERAGIPVLVLDRPNPIGGLQVEGTLLLPEFASFVGLYPLPMRHGLTIGEIAGYLQANFFVGCDLQMLEMTGWERRMWFDDTGVPWAMPSPNMPSPETAAVYPGGCLIEGTNLSEGRGTTRPFEIVGAPYHHCHRFCSSLNRLGLPGVKFRPVEFEPTFNKHAGELCQGCFVHVLDRALFEPVLTFIAILQESIRTPSSKFEWKKPPYEYEYVKRPIDILAGNGWLADAIESGESLWSIRDRLAEECSRFNDVRADAMRY